MSSVTEQYGPSRRIISETLQASRQNLPEVTKAVKKQAEAAKRQQLTTDDHVRAWTAVHLSEVEGLDQADWSKFAKFIYKHSWKGQEPGWKMRNLLPKNLAHAVQRGAVIAFCSRKKPHKSDLATLRILVTEDEEKAILRGFSTFATDLPSIGVEDLPPNSLWLRQQQTFWPELETDGERHYVIPAVAQRRVDELKKKQGICWGNNKITHQPEIEVTPELQESWTFLHLQKLGKLDTWKKMERFLSNPGIRLMPRPWKVQNLLTPNARTAFSHDAVMLAIKEYPQPSDVTWTTLNETHSKYLQLIGIDEASFNNYKSTLAF